MPLRSDGREIGCISRQRLQTPHAQTGGIGGNPLQPSSGAIHRPDLPLITDQFRQMGCFPSGRRTGIEDPLPRHRCQQWSHPLGGAILHRPVTLVITGPVAQIAAGLEHLKPLRTARDHLCGDTDGCKGIANGGRAGPQLIDAQIHRWDSVAGGSHSLGSLLTPPIQQLLRKPIRQRMLQGQTPGWVLRQPQHFIGITGPQRCPQQAIHHRGQSRQTHSLGQLHAGVDRGGCGDPLHPEQLIQAQMQQPTQFGRLLQGRNLAQTIQPGIQPAPPADGAIGELGCQATILTLQRLIPQSPFKSHIGIGPRRDGEQHIPGQPP